jgi:hypothetical protein
LGVIRKIPPRIFGIVARDAPVVAVFRRGPSKQVALLEWNLKTDKVKLGQWFKGRIYKRRADLSPDGKLLIYFAANHRGHDSLGGSWTAVSEMPYLRAKHLYAWGHCWNGGGLFLDNKRYWLNRCSAGDGAERWLVDCAAKLVDQVPDGVQAGGGEDPVTYVPRLIRDGWRETGRRLSRQGESAITFEKTVARGWAVEKTFVMGSKVGLYGECYTDRHRLIGPKDILAIEADWVEVREKELLLGHAGCLWRQKIGGSGPAAPRLIADLTDMQFEVTEPLYAGVIAPKAKVEQ